MDCIQFQKMIPSYMEGSLSGENLNDFLNHLRTCSKCEDELEINFIVSKGVNILDEKDANYDLKAVFSDFVRSSKAYLEERKGKKRFLYAVDTLVFWVVIFCALMVYFRFLRP